VAQVNLDGFGVGWFDYAVKTATPSRPLAKNARSDDAVTDEDTGLPTASAEQLAAAVASRVVFTHIRAGTCSVVRSTISFLNRSVDSQNHWL
jgi:hypothetical protein